MSDQKVELVQVVVRVNGELCQVLIPKDYGDLVVRMLQGVCDGALKVVRLPADMKTVNLSEVC